MHTGTGRLADASDAPSLGMSVLLHLAPAVRQNAQSPLFEHQLRQWANHFPAEAPNEHVEGFRFRDFNRHGGAAIAAPRTDVAQLHDARPWSDVGDRLGTIQPHPLRSDGKSGQGQQRATSMVSNSSEKSRSVGDGGEYRRAGLAGPTREESAYQLRDASNDSRHHSDRPVPAWKRSAVNSKKRSNDHHGRSIVSSSLRPTPSLVRAQDDRSRDPRGRDGSAPHGTEPHPAAADGSDEALPSDELAALAEFSQCTGRR